MDANDVLALGLGVTPPWKLVGQRLDTSTQPNQLHIEIAAERGALFPCPVCGKASKAQVTLLPDSGPVGKVPTDLEGCDDEADEAAVFAGVQGAGGCAPFGAGGDAGECCG